MKKVLIALSILMAGATVFCTLQNARARVSQAAADTRQVWMTQTQLIAQAQSEQKKLQERVAELKDLNRELSVKRQATVPNSGAALLACNRTNLSPAQSEALLAELGFDWNRTGDYLVVSKESLRSISFDAMKGLKLTDTACQVLAITPEERTSLESMMQQLGAEYTTWAQGAVRREEPTGDVVAKYTMPIDPAFSQSLSNRFCAGVLTVLGPERSELLRGYGSSWMEGLGMFGGEPSTMKVTRHGSGEKLWLNVEIRCDRSSMSTSVTPYQPFPETFRPLFPGGWSDLAQREGFELPKEFRTK